ncbi:MAG: molybdopterin-guanine dinucleotide biosynthesis protein B [Fuerstiella sp.]|nr:molybdopterin-guanine dinucleotide biosynthesis protein B [Fuerstiella sp.]
MTDADRHESQLAIRKVPRIHIVGRKNSGKTTLVCELVRELTRQGHKVATIKHTHHDHELDTPGKDSHQHRESGAAGVGILSSQMTAAFVPVPRDEDEDTRYARFNIMFNDCDLILVEGDLSTTATKLEVWRNKVSDAPYAASDASIAVVVSDDAVDSVPVVWPRSNISELARRVVAM